MTANTVAKTYRFSSALYNLIVEEAEKSKTSEAEVVRLALRNHFKSLHEKARIDALEQRVISSIETHSQQLASLVKQVIALAKPE